MIKASSKRDNLAAKLGDESTEKKKPDGVGGETIETERKAGFGLFKVSDFTKTFTNKILNDGGKIVTQPGNEDSNKGSKDGPVENNN